MRKFKVSYLIALTLGFLFLTFRLSYSQQEFSETLLREYLDDQEVLFEDISVQFGEAMWNLYSDEEKADLSIPKQRFFELFHNDTLIAVIDTWYPKRETLQDSTLRRRIEIWHNILTATKVNYDPDIFELQTELEIWLTEEDSLVGRPSQEELENMALKLMKLRNEKAGLLGFEDYPALILETTGLGADWFYAFVATVDSATIVPYHKLIKKIKTETDSEAVEFTDVRKFLLQYYTNKEMPESEGKEFLPLMQETLNNLGFDYDSLPARFIEKDLPLGIGGQGIAVQIPNDFRAVVEPSLSLENRMHELGHGLQWMFTEASSPVLKGYEWCAGNDCGAFSEGMAETCARFVRNPHWLKRYAKLTDEDIAARGTDSLNYAYVFLRFQLMNIMSEIEYYRNLDSDLKAVRRKVARKYLLIDQESARPLVLANVLYVSYPIYVQSYLLADIISWQIHSTLEKKFGSDYVFNENVGPYLINTLYKSGELYPWQAKLKLATGRELDVEGYLKFMGLSAK